jgi:hypothetical protein
MQLRCSYSAAHSCPYHDHRNNSSDYPESLRCETAYSSRRERRGLSEILVIVVFRSISILCRENLVLDHWVVFENRVWPGLRRESLQDLNMKLP